MVDSILDERIYGLISITGLYGVGKTTLATTLEHPKLTAMIDFDLKFKAKAEKLGIWYRSPEQVDDVLDFNFARLTDWFKKSIEEIPAGTTTVVFDNASYLEALLGHIVSLSPKKYGVDPSNAANGGYGGVNPGVGRLWKNIMVFLQKRGVKVFVVISHVSSPWINGKPVLNKFRGKGNKVLQELSNLSLVLVKQDKTKVPAALVLKEAFVDQVFTDEGWVTRSLLPLRFPKAEWREMVTYFDKPANFANPNPGEVPTKQEIESYGEMFSLEQIEFIKVVANSQFVEDGDTPPYIAPEPAKPEPVVTTPKTNGHKNHPMTMFWSKVKELGLSNGAEILEKAGKDPVKALAMIDGTNQTVGV